MTSQGQWLRGVRNTEPRALWSALERATCQRCASSVITSFGPTPVPANVTRSDAVYSR